jgi:hypothetical protein
MDQPQTAQTARIFAPTAQIRQFQLVIVAYEHMGDVARAVNQHARLPPQLASDGTQASHQRF